MESIRKLYLENFKENRQLYSKNINPVFVKTAYSEGFDIRFIKGSGQYLFDKKGNRYLDCVAGSGKIILGRNDTFLKEQIKEFLKMDTADALSFGTSSLSGLLAKKILNYFPSDAFNVNFLSSESEAVDNAIRYSRFYSKRDGILSLNGSYHGNTYGALSINGDKLFRKRAGSLLDLCVKVPVNNIEKLEEKLKTGKFAAFFLEPVESRSMEVLDQAYVREAALLCKKYETQLVFDEKESAFGRTGEMFAFQHYGIVPDFVLFSSGLSNCMVAVGGMVCKKEILKRLLKNKKNGFFHHQHSLNLELPLAVSLIALTLAEKEGVVQNSRVIGAELFNTLQKLAETTELIEEIKGVGLLLGVKLTSPKNSRFRLAMKLFDRLKPEFLATTIIGELLNKHRIITQVNRYDSDIIKLTPPLNINRDDSVWITSAFTEEAGKYNPVTSFMNIGKKLASHFLNR